MKFLPLILIAALSLTACGPGYQTKGDTGVTGSPGAPGPVGPPGDPAPVVVVPPPVVAPTPVPETPEQLAIDTTIANENAYRESLGQTLLTSGLSCTVQVVGSGQWLSSSSPGYNAGQGVVTALAGAPSYAYRLLVGFNQPNSNPGPNNVIDPQIQSLFLNNNYKIVCSGQLVVTEDGYHGFSLSSDDGAILTIDGTQVINNDGNHGITTMAGTKNLRADVVHSFSMQYAQSGGGQFALMLSMDGSILPPANLFH